MSSVSATGSAGPSAPLPSSTSSTFISPEKMFNDVSSAQNRIDAQRYKDQHPGFFTRVDYFFNSGAKKANDAQIAGANQYDNIFENLYSLLGNIYQALTDATASQPMASTTDNNMSASNTMMQPVPSASAP